VTVFGTRAEEEISAVGLSIHVAELGGEGGAIARRMVVASSEAVAVRALCLKLLNSLQCDG